MNNYSQNSDRPTSQMHLQAIKLYEMSVVILRLGAIDII